MNAFVMAGLALAVGAPVAKEPAKKDPVPPIFGSWAVQSAIQAGQPIPEFGTQVMFQFAADGKFRVHRTGRLIPNGRHRANPKADPAEVDFNLGGGEEYRCIYKVDGGTLTLCWDGDGGGRPAKFESPAGTKVILITFKRIEPKKD